MEELATVLTEACKLKSVINPFLVVIENNLPYEFEFRIVRPDGTERKVRDRAELVLDGNGRAIAWRGAIHDITE